MITLVHLPDADWLPPGGVVEVALATAGDPIPLPVGLVRLLVTDADGRLFCVPRTRGRSGLDLPTVEVGSSTADAAVRRLAAAVLGSPIDTEIVGFARNIVVEGTTYDWPSPVAHFVVVRPTVPGVHPVVDGVWVNHDQALVELSERHWWPLLSVDHARVAELQEEPAAVWGSWIGEVEHDRTRIQTAATNALVAGLDTPALRELTRIDNHVARSEIDSLILRAADELAMSTPIRDTAR